MGTKVSTLYLVPPDVERLSLGLAHASQFLYGRDDGAVSENHPDLLILAPAPKKTSIGIDQVRDVVRSLHFAADNAQRRVCLIPTAEVLTLQAANALLKAIEEPPRDALFVLLATHAAALPPTIVSRLCVERIARSQETAAGSGAPSESEEISEAALEAMVDAEVVGWVCDEPLPTRRRRGVRAILGRARAGSGSRAVAIATEIAARGREAVARFVEDAARVLSEDLRSAAGAAGDEDEARHVLHLCRAALESRRGCERFTSPEAVILSFLLAASGGSRG